MSELTLFINGQQIPFSKADIAFSTEQLAHSFSATVPDLNIDSPLPVQFKLDGKLIFNGQIDSAGDDVNSSSEQTVITGRSLSANLIDSRIKLDAIYNQRFDQLLKLVVSDFGLTVRSDTDALPEIPEFQINAESPLANLAQIAKQQNLMMIEDNGEIVIQQPGQHHEQGIILEVGKNCESLSIKRNFAQQFYRYEIQGAWGEESFAVVNDESVNKCRIKVIIADKLQYTEACKTRALYEKNLAIAKGLHASVKVAGLHALLTGQSLNKTLRVKHYRKKFDETLLIKTITLSVDDKSESTRVEFFRPFGVQ
ncbi:tail protein [Psychromonas hadalis]|uniref:tail protein n=1 Tax=Psychromonas hadalis TaxID=211669 RepID=UPI0003B53A9B|nr:tail protein [Psychromonas hadalis]